MNMSHVLARRRLLTPWNWVYAKRIDIDVEGIARIVETTNNVDEAIVFRNLGLEEYVEIEDHFSSSRFSLRQI